MSSEQNNVEQKSIEKTEEGVVIIDYNDLIKEDGTLHDAIETAYGTGEYCLGVLVVKNIPDFVEMRAKLLPIANDFGQLPEDVRAKYEVPESKYSTGWSHGKEFIRKGVPDTYKGSYYNNPQMDDPAQGDEELAAKLPEMLHKNVWPTEDCPEMEDAFKALGQKICDVGFMLAKLCDQYVEERCEGFEKGKIYNTVSKSTSTKARLLHYFPREYDDSEPVKTSVDELTDEDFESWCGWHLDHGSITGLTCAMYIDEEGNEIDNPDPLAGLYIRSRSGDVHRAKIPRDCLAFQIGESSQIHSGGRLVATPHCVRAAMGPKASGVSRNTFPVFMEPNYDDDMALPKGDSAEGFVCGQWKEGMTFAEFSDATFKHYYDNMGD